jgi:predicted GH43/DUF377 family glycosyl hydrolase
MQPDDTDAALLPRRINGRFAPIHRPWTDRWADIWLSFSPHLRNWRGHKLMLPARRGSWWDANRIGLAPPLIQTPHRWLMLYHGVRRTAASASNRVDLECAPDRHVAGQHCSRREHEWPD